MALTGPAPVVLESGDRLSRDEFFRRYLLRPDLRKAELIQGVVYVASPRRVDYHGRQQALAMWWLTSYELNHPEVRACGEASVFLSDDALPQPDAMLLGPDRSAARL